MPRWGAMRSLRMALLPCKPSVSHCIDGAMPLFHATLMGEAGQASDACATRNLSCTQIVTWSFATLRGAWASHPISCTFAGAVWHEAWLSNEGANGGDVDHCPTAACVTHRCHCPLQRKGVPASGLVSRQLTSSDRAAMQPYQMSNSTILVIVPEVIKVSRRNERAFLAMMQQAASQCRVQSS